MKAVYAIRRITSLSTPCKQDRINSLPTELLEEVFLLLHISSAEVIGVKDFVKATMLQVCRPWRAIIESTPAFWTEITIVPSRGPWEEHHLLHRLKTMVARAGILPLHIIWDQPRDVDNDTFTKLAMHLFQYAPTSRWRELTLHNDDLYDLPIRPQHLNILQSLTVTSVNQFCVLRLLDSSQSVVIRIKFDISILGIMILLAPSVLRAATDVEIRNAHLTSDKVLIEFFPNARTLRQQGMSRHVSLSHCTRLCELHLDNVDIMDISPLDESTIEDLHIEHLDCATPCERFTIHDLKSLQVSSGEFWPLRFLNLPNLERLALGGRTGSLNAGANVMVRTLEEPEYSLSPTSATLDIPVTIGVLAWFLRRSEWLQHLTFLLDKRACKKVDELVEVFSRSHGDRGFVCSDLRTIRLVLRWSQMVPKKTGLHFIPSESWRGVAEQILAARSGTLLTSVEWGWEDGFKERVTRAKPSEEGNVYHIKL